MGAPADGPDLADLLAAIARGDRAAFGRLYEITAPKLLGIACRILRDRNRAEDVVQDAYVKVWHGAASYSPETGPAMAWLVSIVRNRAIDLVRSRSEAMVASGDPDARLALIADPEDRAGAFVERQRLAACLDTIEETQRLCFVAAYLEGYSREELAARYDRPVNTIKTWLHRSASALRDCLEDR